MSLITPGSTTYFSQNSSDVQTLMQLMLEQSNSQQEMKSSARKQLSQESIDVQKQQLAVMQKEISAGFRGGLLKCGLGLFSSMITNLLSFKLQDLQKKEKPESGATRPLSFITSNLSKAIDLLGTLNPFDKQARRAKTEAQELIIKLERINASNEDNSDSLGKVNEQTNRLYQTLGQVLANAGESKSMITRI